MIKLKRLSKRTLSLLLALVLVITTFFIFDPDLLRVDSDAKANVETVKQANQLAAQTMYAPETIYLKPGTNQFQYVTNYDMNTGNVTSTKDTSGQIYFKNDDATEVAVAVNKLYKKGSATSVAVNTLTVGAVTVGAYAEITNGADASIESKFSAATKVATASGGTLTYNITPGSFTGHSDYKVDGVYFIEWVFRYVIDGVAHYAFSYTGIYSTPLGMAGISYSAKSEDGSNHGEQLGMSLLTGAMAYGGGNAKAAFTSHEFINVSGGIGSRTVFTNPLISFIGHDGDNANSGSYTMPGAKDVNWGDTYKNTTLFPDATNGGWVRTDGRKYNRHVHYKTTSWEKTGSYADPNPVGLTNENGYMPTSTAGVAYMVVDTSRYTNYNQVPYLSTGWVQFDYHYHGDDNKLQNLAIYDATGGNALSGYSMNWNGGNFEGGDEEGKSFLRGLYGINGPIYNGLFTVRTQLHNGYSGFGTSGVDIYTYVGLHTTSVNKRTLRQQYQTAQSSLCDWYNLTNHAKINNDSYLSFFSDMKSSGEKICDPTESDQVSANPSFASNVKKYSEEIASAFGSKLYFYVPEAIYTKPKGAYMAVNNGAMHYGGVYVNNIPAANDPSNVTIQAGEDYKYGVVHFSYNFAQDIKLTYTLEGNDHSHTDSYVQMSDNSSGTSNLTTLNQGGEYSYGDQGVTKYIATSAFRFASSDSGHESGYWIKWTLSYYDNADGRTKTVTARTYVYRTFYLPVMALVRIKNNNSKDFWVQGYSWMSGIHSFHTTGTWFSKTTSDNNRNNIPYAYTSNVGTESAITTFTNNETLMTDHAPNDSTTDIVQRDLYRYPFQSTDSRHYFSSVTYGTCDDSTAGVSGWFNENSRDNTSYYPSYLGGNSKYTNRDHDDDNRVLLNSPIGAMTIDTSRYSNLNQIPGFSVGSQVTDDDESGHGTFYLSDYTGSTQTDGAHSQDGTGDLNKVYQDKGVRNVVFAGYNGTNFDSITSGDYDNSGVKYHGKGNIAIDKSQATMTYSVKSVMTGYRDSRDALISNVCSVYATQYNKGALRDAVLNAITESTRLDPALFNTSHSQWTTYQTYLTQAQQALTMVDGSAYNGGSNLTQAQLDALATNLNNAVNALLATDAEGNWTSPARLKGTLTVKHVVYYPTQPAMGTRPLNVPLEDGTSSSVETKEYFYGDNITTSYNETKGYNYFGFFRSEEGKTWNNQFIFDNGWESSGGTMTVNNFEDSITIVSNSNDCYTYSKPAFTFKNGHTYNVSYKYENVSSSAAVSMGSFLNYNGTHTYGGNIAGKSSGTYTATYTNTTGADHSAKFRFDIDTSGVTVKVSEISIQDTTPELSLLRGDIAAQGTYGLSGKHSDPYYVGSPNLTYTYVYTAAEAGLYLDLGDADHAFENATNLANLSGANINGSFAGDGTTGGQASVVVPEGQKDNFSYITSVQGTNAETPVGMMKNKFTFVSGWGGVSRDKMWEIDTKRNSIRFTDLSSTTSGDVYSFHNQMIPVTAGHKMVITQNYYRHSAAAQAQTFIFFYDNNNTQVAYTGSGASYSSGSVYTNLEKSGTLTHSVTVPDGATKMKVRIGVSTVGSDVTFKDIQVYDVSDYTGHQKAEMNDIFIENAATGLKPGATYTVSFTSPISYDVRRWYYFDMYGTPISEALVGEQYKEEKNYLGNFEDWSHDLSTIQLFISTTGTGADGVLTNYTVPVKVNTNISTGGTIGTFTMPAGCSSINLGFCITNDDPLSGEIRDIRIVEGDFVQYGKNNQTVDIENGYGVVANPSWDGFTFMGWTEGEAEFDGVLNSATNKYTFGNDSDTILANWKANLYDVSFDNEFDMDQGWGWGTGMVSKDLNTDTNTTVFVTDGDSSTTNYLYANDEFDYLAGHTYRMSFKYSISGSGTATFNSGIKGSLDGVDKSWQTCGGKSLSGSGTYTGTITNNSGVDYVGQMSLYITGDNLTVTISDIYIQDITRGDIVDTTVSEPYSDATQEAIKTLNVPYRSILGEFETLGGNFPVMSSEYFDFAGWYTDKTYTTPADINMSVPYKTTKLFSKWTLHVDYEEDGGLYKDNSKAPQDRFNLAVGASEAVPDYVPYKIGYNFTGWKAESGDPSINGNVYKPGDTVTFKANVTFVAQWEAAPTATLSTEYAVNGLYPGQIYFYGYKSTDYDRKLSAYTYGTGAFDSDIYRATGSTLGTPSTATGSGFGVNPYTAMNTAVATKGTQYYFGIGATQDVAVSATKFKISEHYINYSFNSAGGAETYEGQVIHYNQALALNTPTRTGYTFTGWKNNSRNEVYTTGSVASSTNNAIIDATAGSFVANVQLDAQWDINSYNMTAHAYYNLATSYSEASSTYQLGDVGGTVQVTNGAEAETSTALAVYNTSVTFNAVAKTGYDFKGWYTGFDASTNTFSGQVSTSSDFVYTVGAFDYTLYAQFSIKVYLWNVSAYCDVPTNPGVYTQNSTGGTATIGTFDAVHEGDYNKQAVHGQKITLWAIPEPGYKFEGWYATAAGVTSGSAVIAGGQCDQELEGTYRYEQTIDSNKTYIAKFSVQKLVLTVNENIGEDEGTPINQGKYEKYATETVTLYQPTRTGHTFIGWTLTGDPSGDAHGVFTDNGNGTITYTFRGGNDRITANWAFADYTVTINPNGGNIGSISYQTADGKLAPNAYTINDVADQTVIKAAYMTKVSIQKPTRLGYTFQGWNVSGNKGVFAEGDPATYQVFADDNDTVITAKWLVNTHTMFVKAYGNTASVDDRYVENKGGKVQFVGEELGTSISDNVQFGQTRTIIAVPDTGYSFKGWSIVNPGEVVSSNILFTDETIETPAMGDGDITYYGLFVVNSYNITPKPAYNSAAADTTFVEGETGGTVTGGGKINHGANAVLTAIAKTGYDFVGWYSSLDAETAVSPAVTYSFAVSSEATLYAKFALKKYNVKVTMMANRVENDQVYLESTISGDILGEGYDLIKGGDYYYGTSVTLTAQPKSGYKFLGWFRNVELTDSLSSESSVTITITEPKVYNVWAKFQMLKFDVNIHAATVDSNNNILIDNTAGGKVGFTTDFNTTSGQYYTDDTYRVYAQANVGYIFDGWYTDTALTVQAVGNHAGVGEKEGDAFYQDFKKKGFVEELYAKFKVSSSILEVYAYSNNGENPSVYNVDNPGGKVEILEGAYTSNITDRGAMITANVVFGLTARIRATENVGYIFEGWYSDPTFAAGTLISSKGEIETPAMTEAQHSYYARFDVGRFSIMFNSTGGTSVDTADVYYGISLDLTNYIPSRTGFSFKGWDLIETAEVGSFVYSIEVATINSWYEVGKGDPVTLYAIWSQQAYTINLSTAYYDRNFGGYKYGEVGGTANLILGPGGVKNDDNTIMVPEGAGVSQFIEMTPATGYKVEQWRWRKTTGADLPPNPSITDWTEGLGETGMPNQSIDVIVFFSLNSFDLSFYAYNNSAAEVDVFTNSATGGTVKIGETGTASSKANIFNVEFQKLELAIATANTGYSFKGWFAYSAPNADDSFNASAFTDATLATTNTRLNAVSNDNTTEETKYDNNFIAVFTINEYFARVAIRTYAYAEDLVLTDPDTYDTIGGDPSTVGGDVSIGLSLSEMKTIGDEPQWNKDTGIGTNGATYTIKAYYREKVYYKAEANTGYYFAGWYGAEGSKYYGDNLVDEFNSTYTRSQPARDTYLEAKFFPETFTLIYDANGGASGNPTEIRVTYNGEFFYNTSSNPSKTGHNFLGWADTVNGEVVPAYTATRIDSETISNWFIGRDVNTGTYTVFAVWEVAKVTVTLEKEGGDATTGDDDVNINQGQILPEIEIPIYDGYVFGGYYTEAGGQGEQRYTAEGTSSYTWNTGDGKLYAYWKTPVLEDVEYKDGKWTYIYAADTGTYPLELTEQKPITAKADITAKAPADAKWISSIETVNTTFVDTQIELAEDINLNHYNQAALTSLLNSIKATDTQDKVNALSQPLANEYVATMATSMDLDYTSNRKSESVKPTITIYENDEKLGLVKAETIVKNNANTSFQYPVPNGDKAASYAFANKYSYTKGEAVDYYLYTNTSNPVIAVEIGDGDVGYNTSSYPTKATVTDNAAAFSYVKNSGEAYIESAVQATDDISNAWFDAYTKAGIGTSHDYNAKTVIYLTPEFTSSGVKNEIVYTVKPSDDAYVVNEGVKADGASLGGNQAVAFSAYNYEMPEDTEINICVCYHNAMNGESDEGTANGSGGYLQMYIDQVNGDKPLNQMHLFRISGGASNWELPASSENVYPVNDATYPYELTQNQILGSFMYVFDSTNESYAASKAAAGDYTAAKDAIIQSVKEKAVDARSAIMDRRNSLNINSSGTGLGFAQITGWSTNFYPKEGSYVYAHLVDRWGNVFNRVWKCFKVDQYSSTINQTGANVYAVYETGGSNIKNITLDGANVTFNLDSTSSYENGVLTTTGNTLALSTGEANKTYNLTVTDNATNKTTATVTTDSNGMIVLDVQDSELNPNEGAYTFTLNGETVNLYAGKASVLRDASVAPTAILGESIVFTAKTSSDAIKVQIVEGSATWTYDIDNPLATVVKNDDGTLTWTIPIRAAHDGKHTFGVRAKTMAGWEEIKYYLPCEVIVKNVVSAVALQSVYNSEAYIGDRPIIKARAIVGTQKLQVVYANGGTITYSRSSATILSTVDGVETWALSVSPYASEGSYTVDVIAKFEGQWQTYNAKTSTITVKSKNAAENAIIHSVEFDEEAPRGKYTTFTVLTSAETAKIRFNFPATTTTFTPSNATVVENADGTKLWTVKVRFWSKGEQDVNFSARTTAPQWTEGEVFGTITIK